MASEVTQALPLAVGQLVHQNPASATEAKSAHNTQAAQRPAAVVTQVVAAQAAAQVSVSDKERAVRVPKRTEANFAGQEDREQNEPSELPRRSAKKDPDSKVDIVA